MELTSPNYYVNNNFYLKVHSWVLSNFWQLKLFKNNEKYFLFHVKSYFRSGDIYIFVLTFGYVEKRLSKKAKVTFRTFRAADPEICSIFRT